MKLFFSAIIAIALSNILAAQNIDTLPADITHRIDKTVCICVQCAPVTPSTESVYAASRETDTIISTPVQIEKLTTAEILSTPSGDFYQSIGNYAGVNTVTSSALFSSINMRGFDDTRSLRSRQYIDGADNEAPGLNFALGNLAGSTALDLQSVEVIQGPMSSLYGANTMQGLIEMNTKNPYDYQGFSLQVKGGGTTVPGPYYDVQMRYAQAFGKKKRWAFKLTGEYTETKDWPANNDSINRYGNISVNENAGATLQQEANAPYCPTCPVTNSLHNYYTSIESWLANNAQALTFDPTLRNAGYLHIQAPGYTEAQLADNTATNIKAMTGFYYRFANDVELSATYRFGFATAIYEADSRNQLQDYRFNQPMLQIKGKSYFLRAYTTIENAVNSYNLAFAGNQLAAEALPSYVNAFNNAYFYTIQTLVGGSFSKCQGCLSHDRNEWILDSARNVGRAYAQNTWQQPSAPAFSDSLNGIHTNDRSALVHIEGQYDWDFIKQVDIITGASYRLYMPSTSGTLLEDTSGTKLRESEAGAYIQVTKRLFKDAFKIIASVRGDKNSTFNAQVSPKGSLVYTYKGKHSTHTIRATASYSYSDPTLQQQYIYYNTGATLLTGNLSGFSNVYTQNSVTNAININNQIPYGGHTAAAEAALVPVNIASLKPEHLTSVELGYRAEIAKRIYADVTGYYGIYRNFIGLTQIVSPYNAPQNTGNAAENILSGNYTPIQTWTNSSVKIPAWGADASLSYYIGRGITAYVNYSYAGLNYNNNNQTPILPGFNTPEHKINIGINAARVIKGFGFSANWKWVSTYQWQSTFADGQVPSYHTLDLKIFYEFAKAYSTISIGGSNIYNNMHIEAAGGPAIGALYYAAYTFDLTGLKKRARP